ncbi:unnamed protein product [Echinostoma caproni]|uniref:Uncharacterized protein n=1 Tax=Echinostoma caproni TaxID=27848 RepID=A0A3P8IDZ1_9TREM|nr:unnamed protein product [Echinostoma caproni]
MSIMDLFRLASLVRTLPSARFPTISQSTLPEPARSAKSLTTLTEEADLLRSALRLRILSQLPEMESVDAVVLLQMLCDLSPILTMSERFKILRVIDASMIINPQQRNLYTLVFVFTRMSLLKTFKRGILNR